MTFRALSLGLGLVALLGCGKVEPTDDTAGGGPAASATSRPDPGPNDAGVAPQRRVGNISLSSGRGTFDANAVFSSALHEAPIASGDPCTLTVGHSQMPDVSDSAGDIAIELPSDGKPVASRLMFDAKARTYAPATLDAPLQLDRVDKANAPIRVRAAGATVPAFDVTLLSAYDTTLLAPAAGASLPADSGDLAVRWATGANEVVFATLLVAETSVSCRFPAAAGEGTIPGALLAKALASADLSACGGTCINLLLAGVRTLRFSAGDYEIFVSDAVTSGVALKAP